MVVEELVALDLVLDRERDAARLDRIGTEDRKVLHDDAQLRIGLHEGAQVREGALAVAAIVIEELDERDVALRIARDDRMGGVEERLTVLLEGAGLGDALRSAWRFSSSAITSCRTSGFLSR